MKINLLTKDEYKYILSIFENYPKLTFENKGYEYIQKHLLSKDYLEIWDELENLLKTKIIGFSEFNNFNYKDGKIILRFQYNYGAADNSMHFIGVGYLPLYDLYKGFGASKK